MSIIGNQEKIIIVSFESGMKFYYCNWQGRKFDLHRRQLSPEDMRRKLAKFLVTDCRKIKNGLTFTLAIDIFGLSKLSLFPRCIKEKEIPSNLSDFALSGNINFFLE